MTAYLKATRVLVILSRYATAAAGTAPTAARCILGPRFTCCFLRNQLPSKPAVSCCPLVAHIASTLMVAQARSTLLVLKHNPFASLMLAQDTMQFFDCIMHDDPMPHEAT
jgi:hypothetical protein